jgi:hypothetical protein
MKLHVSTTNVKIPGKRYHQTMTVIAGKFYMYGGSDGASVLDELWVYEERKGTWELMDIDGERPPPR